MPPVDNNTPAPAPTPVPEQPKQGFWAKLFGKKPEAAVPQVRESQTPPPQLDDPLSSDAAATLSAAPADVTTPNVDVAAPSTPAVDVSAVPSVPPAAPAVDSPAPVVPEPDEAPKTTPPSTPVV